MDWKQLKEIRTAYKNLHKINDGDEITLCNKILQRVYPNPAIKAKPLLAFAIGAIEITLDPNNEGFKIKDEIMKSKIRKNIVSFI